MKTLRYYKLMFQLEKRWMEIGLPYDPDAGEQLEKVVEKGHVLIVHTRPDGAKVVDIVDPKVEPIVVL